jgi:hypothetical protein
VADVEAPRAAVVAAECLYAVADSLRDADRWCQVHGISPGASAGVVLAAVRDVLHQVGAALAVADA